MEKLIVGKLIDVEISENQAGGHSLLVSNKNGGERIAGAKVSGCETVLTFTVDADMLIAAISQNTYEKGE
ncbi:hypothetical protein PQD17_gp55 [Pantoea phage PdC23]|uniref:Uncharacterized protein n=1 Tax=Pantoea phage PdC23 TaxID=2894356 RepID=A0AAE9C7Y2_9CAUD|nr:hypothetical protein PQD17_gp55 [Pantoea phage PdC23]UGC97768.1 hypothetical protein pdc_055 [Pantoea phage PdC23]